MLTRFLAHAGEVHESAVEATQHSAQDPIVLWLVLLLLPFVIAFMTHVVFKLKATSTALVLAFFLISFSIYSYQSPGVYTAVSLVTGFALVFVMTFIGLSNKQQ